MSQIQRVGVRFVAGKVYGLRIDTYKVKAPWCWFKNPELFKLDIVGIYKFLWYNCEINLISWKKNHWKEMIWFSSLILKINIFSFFFGVSSFRVSMVWKNIKGKYKATSIQKEVVLLIVGLICQTPSSITARGSRRPFHQNAQLMLSLID